MRLRRIKNLLKQSFVRNVLTLMSGTVVAQAIPLLISPLLTRLYSPSQFGVFALYTAIIAVISVVVTGKYELAIMLPKKDEDAYDLMRLSVISTIVISGLIGVVIWLVVYAMGGFREYHSWAWLLPMSIVATGLFQSLNYWAIRRKQYKGLAYRTVWQAVITSMCSVSFGLISMTVNGLIIGAFLGQLVSTALLAGYIYRQGHTTKRRLSFSTLKKLAIEYREFPLVSTISNLINTFSTQVPIFMLTNSFGSGASGQFSLSQRVMNTPMALVGSSIGQVFFQQGSQYSDQPEQLRRLTLAVFRRLFFIGIIPIAIVMGFGDILFTFVFGDEWIEAGQYAQVLGLWVLFLFVSSPLSHVYTILRRQKTLMLVNIILLVSRVLSLWVGAIILKSDFWAVALFGTVGFIIYYAQIIYIFKLVGKANLIVVSIKLFLYTGVILGIIFALRSVLY